MTPVVLAAWTPTTGTYGLRVTRMDGHSEGRRFGTAAGRLTALITQGLGLLMAAGTTSVACGCLSVFPLLATGIGVVGLTGLLGGSLQFPLLYLSVGLLILGQAIASIRRRTPGPLVATVGGAILVLLPFHTALDVAIFSGFLYSGFAILLGRALGGLLRPPHRRSTP